MSNVKAVITNRYGAGSGLYTLRIGELYSGGMLLVAEHVTGRPWELQRLLPSVRHAIRTMTGNDLKNYLANLIKSFDQWRAFQANH